jgi:hypothetical protein
MNDKIMILKNLLLDTKNCFHVLTAVCLLAPAAAMGASLNTVRKKKPKVHYSEAALKVH